MKSILFLAMFFLISCASHDVGRDYNLGEKVYERIYFPGCKGFPYCVSKEIRYQRGTILIQENGDVARVMRDHD